MASYKAALSAFTAAREAATQERKKKLNAKRSRAVSAYTLFYNEQFDATKAELGTPRSSATLRAASHPNGRPCRTTKRRCAHGSAPRGMRPGDREPVRGVCPGDREPVRGVRPATGTQ